MQKVVVRFWRISLFVLVAALASAFVFLYAPSVYAAQTAGTQEPSTSEELIAALGDRTCDKIIIATGTYTLDVPVTIERDVIIDGGGSTLEIAENCGMTLGAGCTLTLTDCVLASQSGYALLNNGDLVFGEGVSFAGDSGVLMLDGSTATSNGCTVNALSDLSALMGVQMTAGDVKLNNIVLTQATGGADMLLISQSDRKLTLGGSVKITAASGGGIMCAASEKAPELYIENGTIMEIFAPDAVNISGEGNLGGAIDMRGGAVTIGEGAQITLTGSYCGIISDTVSVGKNAAVNISCTKSAGADAQYAFAAGLSAQKAFYCESGVQLSFGADGETQSGGIYCGSSFALGAESKVLFKGGKKQYCALYSGGTMTAGENCSIIIRGAKNGIVCESGFTAGSKCTVDIDDIAARGIYCFGSDSTVSLGADATIKINSLGSAIYAKKRFYAESGCKAELASGTAEPALCIEPSAGQYGLMSISSADLTLTSNAGDGATVNGALYVKGNIEISGQSRLSASDPAGFGIICKSGYMKISASQVYSSGVCGVYVSGNDLALSEGAELYAEGTADSAVRIESGSLSVGGGTTIDAQGARFGVEIIASGGLTIDAAKFFDIRGEKDRAVFIENGTARIIGVERLSAWDCVEGDNSAAWWSGDTDCRHTWELTAQGHKNEWLYADHTALAPSLTQQFSNGACARSADFAWYDGEFMLNDYSRIGAYYTRPVARPNSFYIPAGKSFSWWLYAESYDGEIAKYEISGSSGDGEFILSENGRFTYNSLSYSRGIQSFNYIAWNKDGVPSLPVTVNILVTASKPPVVYSGTFFAEKNGKIVDQLNIFDYDGSIADAYVTAQPQHGTVIFSSDGRFNYQPNEDYVGMDSFTYIAVDNMGDESNIGYVSVAVGLDSTIVAFNDTIVTETGVNVKTSLTAQKYTPADGEGEDLPTDGGAYVAGFKITLEPTYGTVTLSEDGTLEYVPYEDFAGSDVFKFTALGSDGTESNEAIVVIATMPGQRPTANAETFYCTKNLSLEGRLSGADVDGSIAKFNITQMPESGTLELIDAQSGEFVFTPKMGFIGTVSFAFTVTDNDGMTSKEVTAQIEISSFWATLNAKGQLGGVVAVSVVGIMILGASAFLIHSSLSRRKKEREQEEERSRFFELISAGRLPQNYRGEMPDYYDDYDDDR